MILCGHKGIGITVVAAPEEEGVMEWSLMFLLPSQVGARSGGRGVRRPSESARRKGGLARGHRQGIGRGHRREGSANGIARRMVTAAIEIGNIMTATVTDAIATNPQIGRGTGVDTAT
jgi:hypothetical protein